MKLRTKLAVVSYGLQSNNKSVASVPVFDGILNKGNGIRTVSRHNFRLGCRLWLRVLSRVRVRFRLLVRVWIRVEVNACRNIVCEPMGTSQYGVRIQWERT